MKISKLVVLALLPYFLSGCVTTTSKDNQPIGEEKPTRTAVTLSKLEQADLRSITTANVANSFGPSDLQGLGPTGSNQEMQIYLTDKEPLSTRMSLAFDMKTKALAVATWYVSNETQGDFSGLRKRYPQTQFVFEKGSKKLTSVVINLAAGKAPAPKSKKR